MSDNPLMIHPRHDNVRNLDNFIENANRNHFVIASGKPYFIVERVDAHGVIVRYGERNA